MQEGGGVLRHRSAIQLCVLRTMGRFVDDFSAFPVEIGNYVGRQLSITPALLIESPDSPATFTEQEQRIRAYLGYQPFDGGAVTPCRIPVL